VRLRDGTVIYVDVFRPTAATAPLPAIVAWSPYGKRGSTHSLEDFPGRAGVPRAATSGLEKFEAPDPAEWCAHGYAVVNPDPRGAFRSEGDIAFWGRREGQDGHDLIEWVAAQPWSNGKVGLSGNSWLAVSQWFIAAERPPHLAAIAPWEGTSDLYRETVCQGGIPSPEFTDWVVSAFVGSGRVEDPTRALQQQPHWAPYWQDKQARFERIDVPAYVVASWTNPLHVWGTLRGWRGIASTEKWLRVHDSHEWSDYYEPANVADLRRFFDRYLKGEDNGWEHTPRVRMAVLDPGHRPPPVRTDAAYPPVELQTVRLYLDAADLTMAERPPAVAGRHHYAVEPRGQAAFTMRFERDIEFCGAASLHLAVSAEGADDMDLFVHLCKLDAAGRPQPISVLLLRNPLLRAFTRWQYRRGNPSMAALYTPGPVGRLRVSMRALDPEKSNEIEPVLSLQQPRRLRPGEIAKVAIALRPMAWKFHAGERLQVVVKAHEIDLIGIPGVPAPRGRNAGRHVLHTGPEHGSRLVLQARR
jgi:hypothetical protein